MPTPSLEELLSGKNRGPGESLLGSYPMLGVHGCTASMRLRDERHLPTLLPVFVHHRLFSPLQEDDHDAHQESSPILPTKV